MRILIVDDEPSLRRALVRELRSAFPAAEFEDFGDGASALARAAQRRFDAALLDIRMPQMNGFELAQQLAEVNPQIRIAFVSAELDEVAVERARLLSGRDPFSKPWRAQELIDFLRAST